MEWASDQCARQVGFYNPEIKAVLYPVEWKGRMRETAKRSSVCAWAPVRYASKPIEKLLPI